MKRLEIRHNIECIFCSLAFPSKRRVRILYYSIRTPQPTSAAYMKTNTSFLPSSHFLLDPVVVPIRKTGRGKWADHATAGCSDNKIVGFWEFRMAWQEGGRNLVTSSQQRYANHRVRSDLLRVQLRASRATGNPFNPYRYFQSHG